MGNSLVIAGNTMPIPKGLQNLTKMTTLNVVILDSSSSMDRFGPIPQDCVNTHLKKLVNTPDGREQFCLVLTFANDYKVHIKLVDARKKPKMTDYNADGLTLLYKTVYRTLRVLIDLYSSIPNSQTHLKVAVGVFSDGDDNRSQPPHQTKDYQLKLQRYSAIAKQLGFELFSAGIGIDGKDLARKMNFPEDDFHAQTVEPTPAGVEMAANKFSDRTTTFGSM